MMTGRRKSSPDAVAQKRAPSKPQRRGSPSRLMFRKSEPTKPQQPQWRNLKGVMKFTTLEDSLHSKYGSEAGSALSDGSSSGCDETKKKKNRKIRIKFQNIEIREYARTVGDNPSVSSGPPVTISWEYNPNTQVIAVEEYERSRPTRRTQSEMILPRSIRMEMLRKEWNVSQQQIASAVRSGIKAKSQRRTTLGNLGKTEKVEELIEGATKKLLKTLFLRKSTTKRAQELDEKINKANQQRAQIIFESSMREDDFDEDESASPWTAELLPDKDASSSSESSRNLPSTTPSESYRPSIIQERSDASTSGELRFREVHSTNKNDGKPKLPMRDDSRIFLDEPSEEDSSDQLAVHQKQSSGESASQVAEESLRPTTPSKPVITAVEPDDDDFILGGTPKKSNNLPESLHVEC